MKEKINFNLIGLNKGEILSKISELDIYNKYSNVGTLSVGKLNTSPLRNTENKDNTPSFSLYPAKGELKFKDFGGYKLSGNCFDYVKYIFNISYEEALKKIYVDFELHKVVAGIQNSTNTNTTLDYLKEINKRIVAIKRSWNLVDYNYFKQFELPLEFVASKNVYAAKNVYIVTEETEIVLWATDSYKYPIYSWSTADKIKCYRPYNPKTSKWLSTMTTWELQNIETVNTKSDTLFITKSMKDCLVLEYLGFAAVAPGSEVPNIPRKILDYLEATFKRIVILYDNDDTGVKNSIALAANTGYQNIVLPNKEFKDISDYTKEFGLKASLELIKKLIND